MKKTTMALLAAALAAAIRAQGAPVTADTERLQALLDSGAGRVVFPDGTFVVSRPLAISSDTHLVCSPRTIIRLADQSNCPLLRNRGWEPGGSASNITVEGGVWDGNNIHQTRGKGAWHGKPFWCGGGDVNQLIVFAGVKNLYLRGLTVKDPECYCMELTDVVNFTVEDILFDCNCKTVNEDGLHINGFARDGSIRNIRGRTNDDVIALNSDEGGWRSPSNDIVNVTIDGIYGGERGYTGVRLLSREARVRYIVIRNVFGRYLGNGVSFTHYGPQVPGRGHFDDIVIENMFASSCLTRGAPFRAMIKFDDGVDSVGHVTIRNLRRVDNPDCLNETPTVSIGKRVKIDTLLLDNVGQWVPDKKPLIVRAPDAEIRNFIQR